MKAQVFIKTCTGMFVEALFIRAKNWKQPKYPSTGDRVNKRVLLDGVLLGHVKEWAATTHHSVGDPPQNLDGKDFVPYDGPVGIGFRNL